MNISHLIDEDSVYEEDIM